MSEVDIAGSPLDQTQLVEVAKQVSKDKEAYSMLNAGMNQAIVSDIRDDGSTESKESLIRAGRTVGFLEEARTQAQGDPEVAEFAGKLVLDTLISYMPVAGEPTQQAVDYVTEQWLADEAKRLDEEEKEQNVSDYSKRNGQLMALAAEWEATHKRRGDTPFDAQTEIDSAANNGIEHAQGVSGK